MAIEITAEEIKGWFATFMSILFTPRSAKPGDSLTTIILSETRAFGPSPITGGVIHKINAVTAETVALAIEEAAPILQAVLKGDIEESVAFLAAGICGESRFDPNAINPNLNKFKHGETVNEAFGRHDLGIAQFSARVVSLDPGMAGLTNEQIQTKAMDVNFAIPRFAHCVAKLLTDTRNEVLADSSLLNNVPNKDVHILALEGYNTGEHGAKLREQADETMTYGSNWVAKATSYLKILKG